MATTEKGLWLVLIDYTAGTPETVKTSRDLDDEVRDYKDGDEDKTEEKDPVTTKEKKWIMGGYQIVETKTTTTVTTIVNKEAEKESDWTTTVKTHDDIETKTTTYKETDGLNVTKDNTTEIQVGTTDGVVLKLHRITFNRQLYKPNEIIADLQFSKEPSAEDLKTLLGKKVKIIRYTSVTDTTTTTRTDEWFEGFYIHDLLPLKQSGKDFFALFHIYSLDHQLTRKKYSRTYVAKKLFADILLEGIDKEGTPPAYTEGTFNYNTIPTKLKNLFATYYLKSEDNDQYTTFDHLGCTIKDENNKSVITERIQPYLVQYNESFYDFMVRTANRCGEFFFWDDSALRFGRTCTGSGTLPDDDSLDASISFGDCQTVYYTAVNAPDKEKDDNGNCDSAMSFNNDYLTLDDFNTLADISNSADNAPDLNFDDDENYANPASSNSKYLYNDEVNHDVYRTRLYKDRFDSLYFEHVGNDNSYGLSFLSRVLNNTSLYDMIKEFGVFEPLSTIASKCKSVYVNNKENDRHLDNDSRPNLGVRKRKENKVEYYSSFMTADTSGHVNADFYHTIRINEEKLTRQLITFNLTTPKRFRLGQKITYNSIEYVIVQIKDNPAVNNVSKESFKFIDPAAYDEFSNMGNATMQVVAIPLADGIVYPPLHPGGHVRRSEPQVAYVAEFHDPEKRGRVRITYPWQHKDDKEASPWIRVLSPSATSESGCIFELAVGDEVLVDYESGNVERPYVAGTLYNMGNATPFYRGNMALISKNGHGIAFSDPVDASKFAAGISPSYTFVRQFLPSFPHGSSDALKLAGGVTLSDAYGFYKIAMSTDQRKIDISSPFGKVNIDAFTGINISAPNGDINIKGQNINIEAGNAVKIISGTNIKKKGYFGKWRGDDMKSWKYIAQVGASFAEGIADYIKPLVTVVDLDLLRKIIEVFLRPIDGTLEIKSHKYLMLEAGRGNATVQRDRYKDNAKLSNVMKIGDSLMGFYHVADDIARLVNGLINMIVQGQGFLNQKMNEYNSTRDNFVIGEIISDQCIDAAGIVNAVYNGGGDPADIKYNADSDKICVITDDVNDVTPLLQKANSLACYSKFFFQVPTTYLTISTSNLRVTPDDPKTFYYDKIKKTVNAFVGKYKHIITALGIQFNNPNTLISQQQQDNMKKYLKKAWFLELLNGDDFYEVDSTLTLADDANNWGAIVNTLKVKNKVNSFESLTESLKSLGKQYYDFVMAFVERDHWKAGKDGQIIFSDQPNRSYYIDENGDSKPYETGAEVDKTTIVLKQKLNTL